MWPEVYKNASGETDSSTFPLKWADMTVACSGAHRLIGRSAFLKGLFVLIQADVGGVWSLDLCGWDLSVGTLHCNVKLFTCFNIWCSTSICVCLEFFFFFFFFSVQYPSIWTISNHMKHWSRAQACNGFACWFMCDAAAFCTTCLQKSQTLDIVKCTGFQCFAGFCFHRSFIKFIFHCAAFLSVVFFLFCCLMWAEWLLRLHRPMDFFSPLLRGKRTFWF